MRHICKLKNGICDCPVRAADIEPFEKVFRFASPPRADGDRGEQTANNSTAKTIPGLGPSMQVRYVLEQESFNNHPRISMKLVSPLSNGQFLACASTRPEQILKSEAYFHRKIGSVDVDIAHLWKSIALWEPNSAAWDCFPDSEEFEVLLTRILETGRCRLNSPKGKILTQGPSCKGQIVWESYSGKWRLAVVTESERYPLRCFRWNHPWYFDPHEALVGKIELDVAPDLLEKLLAIEPLAPEETHSIMPYLNEINAEKLVPPPPTHSPPPFSYVSSECEWHPEDFEVYDEPIEIDVKHSGFEWWFRFEVLITLDGEKYSLFPILEAAVNELPPSTKITDVVDFLNFNGYFMAPIGDRLIAIPFDRIRSILVCLHQFMDKGKRKVSPFDLAMWFVGEFKTNALLSGPERLLALVDRIVNMNESPTIQLPDWFNAVLRPYQETGVAWLQLLSEMRFGGILADDMGLGKTVQMLGHIAAEKERGLLGKPFLVVCPKSVLPNWLAECERFAPGLNVVAYAGPARRQLKDTLSDADVVVTTYPTVFHDEAILESISWRGVALDEAQYIKNPQTQLAKKVRAFDADYRFCMTGTPIENSLSDLWSQFQFLNPELLGKADDFHKRVIVPMDKYGQLESVDTIAAKVRPFIMRRTKQEVATDLPPKQVMIVPIELTGAQQDLYEAVRLTVAQKIEDAIAEKGFARSRIIMLEGMLRLRQACCDPRLLPMAAALKTTDSAKLAHLSEMVQQLASEGRRILIFSQFTSMLKLIAAELKQANIEYVELTGRSTNRNAPVERFQKSDIPVFLISLKAGGTGLNLTAADVVIHYDPWWNPAVEDQATDRAHRIGQDKNVFVYKLIAHGTIEENMLMLQARKKAVAHSIYDDGGTLSRSLTEDDLRLLLQPLGWAKN